jgi:hypothetical protein
LKSLEALPDIHLLISADASEFAHHPENPQIFLKQGGIV